MKNYSILPAFACLLLFYYYYEHYFKNHFQHAVYHDYKKEVLSHKKSAQSQKKCFRTKCNKNAGALVQYVTKMQVLYQKRSAKQAKQNYCKMLIMLLPVNWSTGQLVNWSIGQLFYATKSPTGTPRPRELCFRGLLGSVYFQGTFSEHSGNIHGTFREHSVNIQ